MNRRTFLKTAIAFPSILQSDRQRLSMPGGIQCGDVTANAAVIWSRTERPARMIVEYASNDGFRDPRRAATTVAESSGYTGQIDIRGLRPGQTYFYRVHFEDLRDSRSKSISETGQFRTPPQNRRDVRILWTADMVGQGWGINSEFGGIPIYKTMGALDPDLFIHSGDQIYADNPLESEVKLDDGTIWKNLVTPAKSKVAETLDEFRGNFAYNLLDENVRRFNSRVPMVVQWDDHEVRNNWYPQQILDDPRYWIKEAALLAAHSKQAMFDYLPVRRTAAEPRRVYRSFSYGPAIDIFVLDQRSYRGPNGVNRETSRGPATAMMGTTQLEWLKKALARSRATWKLIASDMPLGLRVGDGMRDNNPAWEAWANGDGPALGRELELADLLSFVKKNRIPNLVWITADVHYAAAHHYDPSRAVFRDFDPFWEFVAGPMHAGTFGPNALDNTFGPEVRFHAVPPGMKPNRGPADGLQFFGVLDFDAKTGQLKVSLKNLAGATIHAVTLDPG